MSIHFNNALDDPLVYDRQSSCTGGMVSWVRANLLGDQQCAQLFDVDAETNLILSNRRGFRQGRAGTLALGAANPQGVWWFSFGNLQRMLFAADGALYGSGAGGGYYLIDGVAVHAGATLVWGEQLNDRFWICDEVGPLKEYTTTKLEFGGAGTAITDGPFHHALVMLKGHRYRLFGVNPLVLDEVYCSRFLPTAPQPFTLAGQPILPFKVGNGDGQPVQALFPWKGLFSLVAIKSESVVIIDTTPAGNVETAAVITANFGQLEQAGRVGTVAPRSFARTGNDFLFLASDGVRSLGRTLNEGDGELSEPISQPIMDWIRRINQSALANVSATYWQGRYMLSVPIDTASRPSHIFIFNTRTGAWMIWTQVAPMHWSTTTFRGEGGRLVSFHPLGDLLEWRDWVPESSAGPSDYRDNILGTDQRVPWKVRTRAMIWNDLETPKHLDGAEFEFAKSSARVDVSVLLDEGEPVQILDNVSSGFGGLLLPFTLPARLGDTKVKRIPTSLTHLQDAREVSFEMTEAAGMTSAETSESITLRLRSIQAGAYYDTIPKQG